VPRGSAPRASSEYVIRAERLFDGRGDRSMGHPTIRVHDGVITEVRSAHDVDGDAGIPGGSTSSDPTQVVDLPGCTLLPGLIDAHVHLNNRGDGTSLEDTVRESDGVLVASSASAAARALAAGITTVRDTGARGRTTFALRRAIELGLAQGPRLVLCGQPLTITGGHTWYLGGEADGAENLRVKVRELIKEGADFIKVIGSGGGTLGTSPWLPSFDAEELSSIVDTAHALERKVTVHCLSADAMRRAIRAGADQIEHGSFLVDQEGRQEFDPVVSEQLAAAGVPVTPTLSVGWNVIDVLSAETNRTREEQALLDLWRRRLEEQLRNASALRDLGVTLVAGTDAGWRFTPFDGLPTEISLLADAGMTNAEALRAATSTSAAVLGLEHQIGEIRPGLSADLIAVEGDLLDDLSSLRNVRFVMRAGRVHFCDPALLH
jgi:imidazolonepropionase-like amidohydrolase